jgi:hypothetical protein
MESTNLKSLGHRFVLRAGAFSWRHHTDTQPGDVDCTDMEDAEFEALAFEVSAK